MNLFDLSGKTAVVTGGIRGIGLMIARRWVPITLSQPLTW
jgi:short-subunit dehydrogenase involved in D-alanine esterification of teichoic acids